MLLCSTRARVEQPLSIAFAVIHPDQKVRQKAHRSWRCRATGSRATWLARDGTPFETSVKVFANHAVFGQVTARPARPGWSDRSQ